MTEEGTASIKLTREQLYKEIWEISVAGVAKKYGAHYNELLKLCKEMNIPVPPSGYWVQLQFGKSVTKTPLPENSVVEVVLPTGDKPKRIRKMADSIAEKEIRVAEGASESEELLEKDEIDAQPNEPDPFRVVQGKYNTYNRMALYNEVWTKPVTEVAKQYGVSDVAIHKVCKALNVPTPPPGYWARVKAGAKLARTPLPNCKDKNVVFGARTYEGEKLKDNEALQHPLQFMSDTERELVLQAAQEIRMSDENASLHKKIIAYKKVVKEWNLNDRKAEGSRRQKDCYYNPPFLAGLISTESLPRVYRILDALFRTVEMLGGSVNDDLSLQVRNEHVRLEITEGQDKVTHVITRQEAQDLMRYQDQKHHSSWAKKPQIREYDHVFNGRLRISVRQRKYFKDTDNVNVESKLGDILIDLYEEAEVVRIDREAREEAERKRQEEARRRAERRQRYNEEVERTIALENAALDYEIACRIRDYVKAVETSYGQNGLSEDRAAWVDWATKKADWFDPIVARNDELFGKREHKKSIKEKMLEKVW